MCRLGLAYYNTVSWIMREKTARLMSCGELMHKNLTKFLGNMDGEDVHVRLREIVECFFICCVEKRCYYCCGIYFV
jgi:hypothetical protein